jgi:hypothetical protein
MNKMSIVSAKIGDVAIPSKKRGAVNAIQWGQDEVPDYKFPPQLPTVNQFRKIRVPSANPRASPPGCDVPVKFKQENDDYQRPQTEMFEATKLKPAVLKTSTMDFSALLNDMTETTNPPYDYSAGIRPSVRAIKFDSVAEPSPAMFRS